MSNTNDFSGVKVGDKLWSIQLGECEVECVYADGVGCFKKLTTSLSKSAKYALDGKFCSHDEAQGEEDC